ncbi:MAG: helix-turn-helix domain-containing protein [Chloroflexi bacterium]|nr:helix-turn-helix domain-containing protein [Chloroflexota bacterium]
MPDENEQPSPIDPLTVGEIITIPEAAQLSGFNATFLRELATKGRLRAKKSGITWLTTMEAVEAYKKSRNLQNIPKKYRAR